MPDLIYNVKFKIASKIDDLGGAGAAKSLTELNEAVDKTNRSTGKLGQEVKDLVDKNTEFIASNGKVKASIDNKRKATQNELRTIAKTNLEARARIKQIREEKINLDKFIQSNKLNTAERTKLLGQSTRLERQEKELIGVLQTGRAALQGQETETEQLTTATKRLANAKKKLGKATTSNNKAFSTANQTLFSFSDGVQDAAQFIQGGEINFAQGMRAVGNNIGFTAELMGNLTTKTGSLKKAFAALGMSLMGPGGILIGINLLITAATVLPQLLGKNKESAEELEEALEGLNDVARRTSQIIAQTGAFDLGIEGLKGQKEVLSQILQNKKESNDLNIKSLEIELEEAKIRARQLKESHQFRVFFEGQVASQEMVKQGKQDVLDIEQKIARVTAENKKTEEEIRDINKDITNETEARRLAGLKLQEEGFVDAVKATLNVEPEFVLLEGTEELDALFKSFEDEQAARESVKVTAPVDIIIEEDIEIEPPDLDLGPMAGTIAFAQEQIKELTSQFNNTLESEEATSLANRINILKDFIAERQALLNGASEDTFADDMKENLDIAGKFTKSFASLKKTQLKSELQAAKARGASAKELEAIRKKQFQTEKRSAIAEALINTAKAITENLGKPKKIAIAAALGAIQIAKIKATKFGGGTGAESKGATLAASSGILSTSGEDRPSRINRPLFRGENNFLPSASGTGGGAMSVNVINTFNDRTVASVTRAGNESRRQGAVSGI